MTDLLKSVKDDLLDRRMLPLVALVVVALLAAIGYAVLGGSSGSSTPSANVATPHSPITPGIAVSETNATSSEAVSETTDGTKDQRNGPARNPFAELPSSVTGNKSSTASTGSSSSSSTSSSTSNSTSSSGSKSESKTESSTKSNSKPSGSSKPAAKPKTVYLVALQFGAVPAGTPAGAAQLTPYSGLTGATPLPSAKERLIEFVGVTVSHSGVSASFAVDAEVILNGQANCLPSATQCKVLDLKPGKTETVEYLAPNGTVTTYELRVVTIASKKASAATVSRVLRAQQKISGGLLAADGALRAAGLRFTSIAGVLTFASRPASAARAHTALH